MDNCIEVLNVSKSFGEEKVLKNVSHTFEKGKIHGIVGNNGSGKTVLMKCICGFLRPDEGKILVNHIEVGKETDFPEDIGIIIETPGFLPHLSGFQNLKLLASLRKIANDHTIRDTIELVRYAPAVGLGPGSYGRSQPADPGRTAQRSGQEWRSAYTGAYQKSPVSGQDRDPRQPQPDGH